MQPSRLVPPPPTGFLRSSRYPTSFRRCTRGPFSSSATTPMACLLCSRPQSSLQSPAALMMPRLVARSAPALSANPRQGLRPWSASSASSRHAVPPVPAHLRHQLTCAMVSPSASESSSIYSRSRGLLQPGLEPPPDQPAQFQPPVIMPTTHSLFQTHGLPP